MEQPTPSKLIVYGVHCVWWDGIEKSGSIERGSIPTLHKPKILPYGQGLPCCPHCGSVLFQTEPGPWFASIKEHDQKRMPGYEAMWLWSRGKCFQNLDAMTAAYRTWQARN